MAYYRFKEPYRPNTAFDLQQRGRQGNLQIVDPIDRTSMTPIVPNDPTENGSVSAIATAPNEAETTSGRNRFLDLLTGGLPKLLDGLYDSNQQQPFVEQIPPEPVNAVTPVGGGFSNPIFRSGVGGNTLLWGAALILGGILAYKAIK